VIIPKPIPELTTPRLLVSCECAVVDSWLLAPRGFSCRPVDMKFHGSQRVNYRQTGQNRIRLTNDSLPWFTMSIIASGTNVTGTNTGSTLAGLLKSSSVCALPFRFFSCECVAAVFAWRFRCLSLLYSFHGTRRRISEQALDS